MNQIPLKDILSSLDGYFGKKEYQAAEKLALHWLEKAEELCNKRAQAVLLNELAGLYRKLSQKEKALDTADKLLALTEASQEDTEAATAYLNCATVFKAFGDAQKAIALFRKAKVIYERDLPRKDSRLAGLYNNMALALVDLREYSEAYDLYRKALDITLTSEKSDLEAAITYLNIASAKDLQLGAVEGEEAVTEALGKARLLLDRHSVRDSYYAFVCEKCASVYGYFGYFLYEKELYKRASDIYEGS